MSEIDSLNVAKDKEELIELVSRIDVAAQRGLSHSVLVSAFEELFRVLNDLGGVVLYDPDDMSAEQEELGEMAWTLRAPAQEIMESGTGELLQDSGRLKEYATQLHEFADRLESKSISNTESTLDSIVLQLTMIYDHLEAAVKKAEEEGSEVAASCDEERQALTAAKAELESFENESRRTDSLFDDVDSQLVAAAETNYIAFVKKAMDMLQELYMSFPDSE